MTRAAYWMKAIASGTVCFILAPTSLSADEVAEPLPEAEHTWWIGADPHVGFGIDPEHYAHGRAGASGPEAYQGKHLKRAVADVNELGIADYAVILGDLVADSHDLAEPFVRIMDTLDTPYGWTYILGNHDYHGPHNPRETGEPVLPIRYSARTVNGIRFIFLSTGRQGELVGDDQEEWFWDELDRLQGQPVFLFTHHPHDNGFEAWSRLKDVIEDHNIVAWFSAHAHAWRIENTEYGFRQFTIHAIGGIRHPDLSSFLFLNPNHENSEVEVTVKFRNHRTGEWIEVDGQRRVTFAVSVGEDE